MKITLGNMPIVVAEYMEKVILPKAQGWQKWAVGVGAVVATDRAAVLMQSPQVTSWLEMVGVLKDGFVDMDELRRIALAGMEKSGSFNAMGYVVDKDDIEAMYELAKPLAAQ